MVTSNAKSDTTMGDILVNSLVANFQRRRLDSNSLFSLSSSFLIPLRFLKSRSSAGFSRLTSNLVKTANFRLLPSKICQKIGLFLVCVGQSQTQLFTTYLLVKCLWNETISPSENNDMLIRFWCICWTHFVPTYYHTSAVTPKCRCSFLQLKIKIDSV